MQKSLQLYITLDKEFFFPNDMISGTVHLKTQDQLNLEMIGLKLTKSFFSDYEDIQEEYLTQISNENIDYSGIQQKNREIEYDISFTLYSSIDRYSKFSSGHHKYPFKFYLKPKDNASCDIKQLFDAEPKKLLKISNTYKIEVYLKLYGFYMPLVNTEKEIIVSDSQIPRNGNKSLYKLEDRLSVKISSCIFFLNSVTKLISNFDKIIYFSGETLKLKLQSKGSSKVNNMDVYLYQAISCIVSNKIISKSRLINKTTVKKSNTENEIFCDLDLPLDIPSTASEKKYEIKYFIQMIIRFDRSAPVWWKREVFIVKKGKRQIQDDSLQVLKGIDAPVKYFCLQ